MKDQISLKLCYALISLIFLINFTFTCTNIAEIYIISELGGSRDITSYSITFYGIGIALGMPLYKVIIRIVHFNKCLLFCLFHIFFLSFISVFCEDETAILIIRFLMGFISAPMIPIVNLCLKNLCPHEHKDHIAKNLNLANILSPVVGSMIGALIAYNYNWRIIYLIQNPIIVTLFVTFYVFLYNKKVEAPQLSFNFTSYFLYCLAIIGIGCGITLGQLLDWDRSNIIWTLFIVGGISLIGYFIWEINHPNPLFDLNLFKHFRFNYGMIMLGGFFCNYFGTILLLGLWLNIDVTYTPNWIALTLGSMAVAASITYIFSSHIHKLDPRIMLILSALFFSASSFFTSTFSEDIDFWRLAVSRAFAGFGLAFFPLASARISIITETPQIEADSQIIYQIVRFLGAGFGSSLYTQMWWRRTAFYHERLGSQLTVFSDQTKFFFEKAKLIGITGNKANAELESQLNLQSRALALDDCFYFMGWVFVAFLVFTIFTFFLKTPITETKEEKPLLSAPTQ